MRTLLVLTIIFMAPATAALAETDEDILKASGLAGKWALDCTNSSSYQLWTAVADGHVARVIHTDKGEHRYLLTSLKVASEHEIALSYKEPEGQANYVLRLEKGGYRVWFYARDDADTNEIVFVKNGMVVPFDLETQLFQKCED